jgi:hypothetical protein
LEAVKKPSLKITPEEERGAVKRFAKTESVVWFAQGVVGFRLAAVV